MSKKTVRFTSPAKRPETTTEASGDESASVTSAIETAIAVAAQPDEWVRDRALSGDDDQRLADTRVLFDIGAPRTLAEVFALCAVVPFALGWFWFINAMAGRLRF